MKSKKILLISTLAVITALNLIGCSNEKDNLNQSITITDDVKSDTEPKLKIESTETISFETPLDELCSKLRIDKDNNLIYEYKDVYNKSNEIYYNKINIEDNVGKIEFLGRKEFEEKGNYMIHMNIEKTKEHRILVSDYYGGEQYEVEQSIFSDENMIYSLIDNILIKFTNNDSKGNKIFWYNLLNNEQGSIDIPYEYVNIMEGFIVENKLILKPVSADGSYNNIILVLDLLNNKIESEINVGDFYIATPIDKESAILYSKGISDDKLEVYNLNNKTRNEIVSYPKVSDYEKGEPYSTIHYIGVFSDKTKMYYCESDGYKMYIKVATISGMNIEDTITVYEKEYDSLKPVGIPNILIGKDERDIIIYDGNIDTKTIDSFKKIRLNK